MKRWVHYVKTVFWSCIVMVVFSCVLGWPAIGLIAFTVGMLAEAVNDVIPPGLVILVLLAIPFWLIFIVLDEWIDAEWRPFE